MRKAQVVTGIPCVIVLASSVANLLLEDGLYASAGYSGLFLSNDIVNAIAALAFVVVALATRPRRGLLLGIDTANIYIAVPLALAYGLRFQALIPLAALVVAVFGVIDQLKIEEVLVSEKGPMRKEHALDIAVAILLGAVFAARAISILVRGDASTQDRVTGWADLALVLVWIALVAIAIANPDKRVTSLAGIMTGGTALNLSLLLFMAVDSLVGEGGVGAPDVVVISAMSLLLGFLSYRLLRQRS